MQGAESVRSNSRGLRVPRRAVRANWTSRCGGRARRACACWRGRIRRRLRQRARCGPRPRGCGASPNPFRIAGGRGSRACACPAQGFGVDAAERADAAVAGEDLRAKIRGVRAQLPLWTHAAPQKVKRPLGTAAPQQRQQALRSRVQPPGWVRRVDICAGTRSHAQFVAHAAHAVDDGVADRGNFFSDSVRSAEPTVRRNETLFWPASKGGPEYCAHESDGFEQWAGESRPRRLRVCRRVRARRRSPRDRRRSKGSGGWACTSRAVRRRVRASHAGPDRAWPRVRFRPARDAVRRDGPRYGRATRHAAARAGCS